jgi:hypothetical protein
MHFVIHVDLYYHRSYLACSNQSIKLYKYPNACHKKNSPEALSAENMDKDFYHVTSLYNVLTKPRYMNDSLHVH